MVVWISVLKKVYLLELHNELFVDEMFLYLGEVASSIGLRG